MGDPDSDDSCLGAGYSEALAASLPCSPTASTLTRDQATRAVAVGQTACEPVPSAPVGSEEDQIVAA